MNIGLRIRAGRKMAGLSLRAAAHKAGVSAQAISKYERGLDIPSSGVLVSLATAFGVSLDFLLRQPSVKSRPIACRRRPSLDKKELARVTARASEVLERYCDIEELLGIQPIAIPNGFPMSIRELGEAESIAEAIRAQWGLGEDPIRSVIDTLEDHGIKVLPVEAPDGLDAVALETEPSGYAMALNSAADIPGDRQRFSAAHELGHLLICAGQDLDVERACNRFAGAFLAPRGAVRRELGPKRHRVDLAELGVLKQKYGMSIQAWIHRAEELAIITRRVAGHLRASFRGERRIKEPGEQLPQESPRRLRLLVLRAVAEDVVSESRATELLRGEWPDPGTASALR